ncbi:MAG: Ig-like domain-containing protein, partial [Muribaculaceae bacterium]|nr:Ig-like domain-containing protein [Muribaculaceae bacterium]
DRNVIWWSDNPGVAEVDPEGNVTALTLGEAVIYADSGEHRASCHVTVVPTPVEGITLNQEYAELKVGEILQLIADVYPGDATDRYVTWWSDNPGVAEVDPEGNVTALTLGEAVIYADSGEHRASCHVTVVPTPVEGITLNQEYAEMKVGEVIQLTTSIYPENSTDKTVSWSSDDEFVAIVDSDGNVTALSIGECNIIAMAADGSGESAVCHITVSPILIESITLNPESWNGEEGESFKIEAYIYPEDATLKDLLWTSSDETVATVDGEGLVSVLKEGFCVITVIAIDGSGVSAECMITSTTGIDEVLDEGKLFDVYNLNGILIRKNCDHDFMKTLHPDLYIVRQGNKNMKVIIR